MKTFVFGSTSCSLINLVCLHVVALMVLYEYSVFFFSLHFDYLSSFHKMSLFRVLVGDNFNVTLNCGIHTVNRECTYHNVNITILAVLLTL